MPNYVGRQLGNYRLTKFLGQGAFAEVYLGQHMYLNTQAAIKILKGQITSQERHTFLKEAQMIAQLRHPNIVRILDFGIENDFPFLIMDYIPNTMRTDIPFGERRAVPTVVKFIKQVASALQYAHTQKVIHRDVKPENMLLYRFESIQLSDFGLAVIAHRTQSLTQQSAAAGSPVYMAPEQINGMPRPASDQYALGVVAYEWLTGVSPFTGTSLIEIAMKHTLAPPPPFNKDLHISPHVEQVVLRALAKNPHERFPTIQAFADALEEASNVPHFSVQRLQETVKAPALGTLLLLYKGYASYVYSVSWSPDGTRLAVSTDGGYGIQVLEAKSGHLLYTYRGHDLLVVRMSWSPDGTRIVSGDYGRTVQVWEAESGRTLSTYTEHTDQVNAVSWSPDGTKIASGASDKTVQIWEAKGGRKLYTYTGHTGGVFSVNWSPDGTRIASGASDDGVHIWEVKSGRVLYRYDGHSRELVHAISWSPDGTKIASGASDKTVQIWEAKGGRKLYTCTGHTEMVVCVNWSPDGTRIASSSNDKTVRIWEAQSGRLLCTYRGHSMSVYGLAWSPDGTKIASGSLDETVQIWQAE